MAVNVILVIGVLLVVSATVLADLLWRRWMAARRRERDTDPDRRV